MDKKCQVKFVYKSLPETIIFKSSLFEFTSFDSLKNKIIERSKNLKISGILTEKDKFILEIGGYHIDGLNGIWNSETFQYFFDRIQKDLPNKLKFIISKIDEEPIFKKPKYLTVFKESLKSAWDSTKKEIENELTEKYLNEGKMHFNKDMKENEPDLGEEELFDQVHINVVCNNCFSSNFNGLRYMCCECDNYNLCEFCKKDVHITHKPEHTFIKFNSPVKLDIQKYNCIFSPNKILIKQKLDPFEFDINIINNGEIDLKGCFFSPIRFGNNYLGCIKKSIIEKCEKGDKVTLKNVLIKFDEDELEENINNFYEGYFRLMTIEGIPFGDILYIKFIVDAYE